MIHKNTICRFAPQQNSLVQFFANPATYIEIHIYKKSYIYYYQDSPYPLPPLYVLYIQRLKSNQIKSKTYMYKNLQYFFFLSFLGIQLLKKKKGKKRRAVLWRFGTFNKHFDSPMFPLFIPYLLFRDPFIYYVYLGRR